MEIQHTSRRGQGFHLYNIHRPFLLTASPYALWTSFLLLENIRLIFHTNSWIYSSIFSVILFSITNDQRFVKSVYNSFSISVCPIRPHFICSNNEKKQSHDNTALFIF